MGQIQICKIDNNVLFLDDFCLFFVLYYMNVSNSSKGLTFLVSLLGQVHLGTMLHLLQ